jgi:hypothetical protein
MSWELYFSCIFMVVIFCLEVENYVKFPKLYIPDQLDNQRRFSFHWILPFPLVAIVVGGRPKLKIFKSGIKKSFRDVSACTPRRGRHWWLPLPLLRQLWWFGINVSNLSLFDYQAKMILSFALLSCLLFLFFLPQLFYLCVRRGSLISAGKLC